MNQVTERLCEHTVTVLFRVVISLEIELGHADIGDSPVCALSGRSLRFTERQLWRTPATIDCPKTTKIAVISRKRIDEYLSPTPSAAW